MSREGIVEHSPPKMKQIDIPKHVGEELARLHTLLTDGKVSGTTREWARGRIDKIHVVYFTASWKVEY